MIGKFITFEGIDGCGKSTQANLFFKKLKENFIDCVLTREPGGSKGAEEIRNLLVKGSTNRWSAETEILLFTAARRDHLEKIILPGLRANKIVVSDRFFDSTKIYQGENQSELVDLVEKLHDLTIKLVPDLTFIIDMEPKRALKRGLDRLSGEDRFEEFGLDFQIKLRKGFIELSKKEKKRCYLIDGDKEPSQVAETIYKVYSKKFNE